MFFMSEMDNVAKRAWGQFKFVFFFLQKAASPKITKMSYFCTVIIYACGLSKIFINNCTNPHINNQLQYFSNLPIFYSDRRKVTANTLIH